MPKKVEIPENYFFPKEQKIQIVRDIDDGTITFDQALKKYKISNPRKLQSWMLKYSVNANQLLTRQPTRAEKRNAAYRILNNQATTMEVAVEMKLSQAAVQGWVRNIKRESQTVNTVPASRPITGDPNHHESEELKLKVAALELMIDIAEKEFKIDIRKKSGTKQ